MEDYHTLEERDSSTWHCAAGKMVRPVTFPSRPMTCDIQFYIKMDQCTKYKGLVESRGECVYGYGLEELSMNNA